MLSQWVSVLSRPRLMCPFRFMLLEISIQLYCDPDVCKGQIIDCGFLSCPRACTEHAALFNTYISRLGLENLPTEVQFLLLEMKHKEERSQGTSRKIQVTASQVLSSNVCHSTLLQSPVVREANINFSLNCFHPTHFQSADAFCLFFDHRTLIYNPAL